MTYHPSSPANTSAGQSETGILAALRRRGPWALVLAGGLIAAAAAGATSGIVAVGDVIPGGEPSPSDPSHLRGDETVIATGDTPVAGPWRMTAYESEGSAAQPAGLPCVRLVLTDPPSGTPLDGSGFCGEVSDDFGAVSLPVANHAGDTELLVFGLAPESAARVELTAAGGQMTRAPTQEAAPRFERGDVFVLVTGPGAHNQALTSVNDDGRQGRKRLDASGFFDRLEAVQRSLAAG